MLTQESYDTLTPPTAPYPTQLVLMDVGPVSSPPMVTAQSASATSVRSRSYRLQISPVQVTMQHCFTELS